MKTCLYCGSSFNIEPQQHTKQQTKLKKLSQKRQFINSPSSFMSRSFLDKSNKSIKRTKMYQQQKIYFTAGPAKIPSEVMEQIHKELLDYKGMGISVMEMSHRSKEFEAIRDDAEANIRKLMKIPDNYSVLFMHGGAKTQFDSVPMNLCPDLDKHNAEYIVNGSWSEMAAAEAQKYLAKVTKQQVDIYNHVPLQIDLQESPPETSYRFYCDNETIQGLEFNYIPLSGNVPLVCDMTSNFLSRPVDVSKFGVIFAGAQKNCGISGLTIVIVRKDLIGKQMKITPTIQNYKVIDDNKSLYNTPLTFAIYVANLCFKWALDRGGLEAMDKFSKEKSQILYDTIENSNGFYTCPVPSKSRSRMNVVFLLSDKELDSKFLEEAKNCGLNDLKGHRSVGGFRASIYHGITMEQTKRLAHFMDLFRQKLTDQDNKSTQSHHISLWSLYNGPKLFAKPIVKTNQVTIQHALLKALEGAANAKTLRRMQETIDAHLETCNHFLILFRNRTSFKGLFEYDEKEEKISKLDGIGPKTINHRDILRFYKFDSTKRQFSEVQTKHISLTIIGITIQDHLWSLRTKT